MTTGNVTAVGTGGLSMLLNQFEGGITPLPRSAPFFADLFASAPTSGNTISYAEMKNPDGGAGMTGEGSAKTQADFDLVEAKTNVRKITSYIKTSKEALDDIPALAGEINNELVTLIKLKKDSEVLAGAGTGNTLSGVITNATAFTGGALALSVVTPNNYDVLVAGITQIATAEVISGQPAGFMANVIVMNPSDVALMKLTKDANKNYIFPVTLPGSTSVMEVPVISNARMTAGDFLIMDSSKGNLRIKEDITLSVGYENDDFTKNLVTILAEMRLAFYIKSQHVKAFVKGTFSTAITALTKA
jgi:HK97 family phage major capsid protein